MEEASRTVTRGAIIADGWSSRSAVLLAVVCSWTPPFSTWTWAQAPSTTTTTTSAATTTVTTTLPVPVALQETIADLAALATYTAQLSECHAGAMERTAQGNQLQAFCDTIGRARKRRRCERAVLGFRCGTVDAMQKCEGPAAATVSRQLVTLGIASALRDLLRTRTQGVACMIGPPVDGLTTEPTVRCPAPKYRVKVPKPLKKVLELGCPKAQVCQSLTCTDDALSKIAGAIMDAVACRTTALSKVAGGDVFDEDSCMTQVWSSCRSADCGTQPCFEMATMCAETREFVDRAFAALSEGSKGCIRDGVFNCDDVNPCTMDRCDGERCIHHETSEGMTCDEDGDPCTVDVCREGVCAKENSPGDVPCADDDNPCTLDVCGGGECRHPANPTQLGQPCGVSKCTICIADETTMRCAPRTCREGCVCNPDLGCVQDRGAAMCAAE
jgi:hypothetical protein